MSQSDINALFKVPTGPLAPVKTGVSVGTLEQRLLSVFPAEDACAWDRTGLTVGNPGVEVTGVVVALDPTIAALKEATDLGANVVLTHHPVFIEAVSNFMPETVQGAKPGARCCAAGTFDLAHAAASQAALCARPACGQG